MVRKLNYMKTVAAGAAATSGARHMRRAKKAKERKDEELNQQRLREGRGKREP